ncbi:type IV secretory system conjugative DNA transfer family protein [Lachnospiraceae bacterium NSJ-171]|jgi:type IV secretion system protein VirD4|uniref:Type IV secretory system conjugative DNA transfer family protein n=1 Tax=Eubacterium ventriosum TaxID=39496 RepID=A0A414R9N5_9FIRM|nr:type IV secretory system conjugative DNA transfer family protein [Eubacterium ventriosum]MCJ7966750.1 type IV secretory system conjugative DNA transfer family protein [Lachnospiraceae bacterium NSJ-171]RHF89772.1 type IV secretory system conjugative DNA transfer family protein [Eubacterium ventriosum]
MNRKNSILIPCLIIGELFTMYVSYVLNGVWNTNGDIVLILNKFNAAIKNPFGHYYNANTLRAVIYGSLIYGMAVLMYVTSRRNLMHGKEYGTARFADIRMVNKALADKDESKNRILSNNVRMSTDTSVTGLNNNMLVIGGSGAGKTFFIVKPNIMQMMLNNSFIATDPKGEIARATANMLKKNGYNVKVLNLIDMAKSDGYNPFRYIREENDVVKLVTNIISNTTPKETAPTDPFWEKSESMFLQALFYYVWLEMPPNRKNFQSVLELLSEAEVDAKGNDSKLTKKMKQLAKTSKLKQNHPAYKQYMKVIRGAGDTVRSIIISANSRLALLENPQILRILSKDDLHLEELGIGVNGDKHTRTALFCIIPDSDKSYNFIVGMLYTQLFQELYFQADFKNDGKLPIQVTLMMDEFANVALPDDFCSLLSTMRSRRISSIIIIQNLAQIKALFKDTWETITGNCDTLVYLGGNEKSTHQYISEMLGKSTIDKRSTGETRGVHGSASRNYDVLGRELMTPDEVRNMSNKKCLIFIKGFNPIFDDKYIPFRHKNFSQTEDGGGKAYVHDPSLNKGSLRPVKLLSEKQINDIKEYKKENEVVHIMDMSLEEIMMLDDTKKLYFENSNESESSGDEGSAKTISRTDILENMSEQELMDEITNRMCMMDFSREQIEEITKSLDAHMKLSILLSYLYPTTSAEEMAKKRNEHLSKRD